MNEEVICLDSSDDEVQQQKRKSPEPIALELSFSSTKVQESSKKIGQGISCLCPICDRNFDNHKELQLHFEWCVKQTDKKSPARHVDGQKKSTHLSEDCVDFEERCAGQVGNQSFKAVELLGDPEISLSKYKAETLISANSKGERRKNLKLAKKACQLTGSESRFYDTKSELRPSLAPVLASQNCPQLTSNSIASQTDSRIENQTDSRIEFVRASKFKMSDSDDGFSLLSKGYVRLSYEESKPIGSSFLASLQSEHQPIQLRKPVAEPRKSCLQTNISLNKLLSGEFKVPPMPRLEKKQKCVDY